MLLDGAHLVEDALAADVPIDAALVDDRQAALADTLQARGVAVYPASAAAIDAASPVRSPSGIVAVARWSPRAAIDLLSLPDARLVGVVGVQDPGNVGAVIRSADALGATGVLVLDDSAAPGSWKALRGAMGSTFRIPVGVGATTDVLAAARRTDVRVLASVASGGAPPDARAFTPPVLVLIGSEGAGLPHDIIAAAGGTLTIPMGSRVNSLNAATSAALLLWEMTRPMRDTGDRP